MTIDVVRRPSEPSASERRVLLDAATRLGLNPNGAALISESSRAIWRLPAGRATIMISPPRTRSWQQVSQEACAIRAATTAGVRTPGLVGGPVDLDGDRYALAVEWVDGVTISGPGIWQTMAEQAIRLAAAPTAGLAPLHLDPAAPNKHWQAVIGDSLASRLAAQWQHAAARVADLVQSGPLVVCHGDLHPDNVLVDKHDNGWLLDFEHGCLAPPEWDPAKLIILSRRFGDPTDPTPLVRHWPDLDKKRLTSCVGAQETQLVGWLVQMAISGTAGAATEARTRATSLDRADSRWRHLGQTLQSSTPRVL